MNLRNYFVLILCFLRSVTSAQTQLVMFENTNKEQITFTDWFDQQVGVEDAPIYNDRNYPLLIKARYGHQFFETKQWQNGSICINNQWYFDIPLLFDLIDQQLVVKHYDPEVAFAIAVNMSNVSFFKMGNSSFTKLNSKKVEQFFQVMYKGSHVDLLVKHNKVLDLKSDGLTIEENTSYFLYYEENLIPLKNKGALLNVSPNAKSIVKEIKSKDAKFSLRHKLLLREFIKRFDEKIN